LLLTQNEYDLEFDSQLNRCHDEPPTLLCLLTYYNNDVYFQIFILVHILPIVYRKNPHKIGDIRVEMTIMNAQVTYRAE